MEFFKKAIEINPNFNEAINDLGKAYFLLKDFKNAIKTFELLVPTFQHNAELLKDLGSAYGNLKQWDKAIEYFSRAVNNAPNDADAWEKLAICYQSKGDKYKSTSCHLKALELKKK